MISAVEAARLRAGVAGVYDQEAGVELLIRAFGGRFAQRDCSWIRTDGARSSWVDGSELVALLGSLSGGERRVLTVAAALLDGRQVVDQLGDLMAGLDRQGLHLVLAALAHAGGSHEQVHVVRGGDGLAFSPLPPVVAWPDGPGRAA